MNLNKFNSKLVYVALLFSTWSAIASEIGIDAERILINPNTILNTGVSVEVEGSANDVELFYVVSVPNIFDQRTYKAFFVSVQKGDEVATIEASAEKIGNRHTLSLSQTNLEDRTQEMEIQVTYDSDELPILIMRIDILAFVPSFEN